MKVVLVFVFIALATAHICLVTPTMRPDVTGLLSQDDITDAQNKVLPPIDKCRRNVQLSPFGNNDTDAFGSVCGGNAAHPKQQGVDHWTTPITPDASQTIVAGEKLKIVWIINAAHGDPNNARQAHVRIDFAKDAATASTNDDFIEIKTVEAAEVSNTFQEFEFTVPDIMITDHGIIRVIYLTSTPNIASNPAAAGVSSSYSACADIKILAGVNPSPCPPCPVANSASALSPLSFICGH